MILKQLSFLMLLIICVGACAEPEVVQPVSSNDGKPVTEQDCGINCPEHLGDKIWEDEEGNIWLWGGTNDDWHFRINNISIDVEHLKYGLGRESFQALIDPQYINLDAAPQYPENSEMIVVIGTEATKVFPLDFMVAHEVINDVMDGNPIMVSYCVLADYVGIHSREYCGEVFTFGVSGYTYYEEFFYEGRDGFVLWDRDTESLWWPLMENGISGPMKNVSMNRDVEVTVERLTWAQVKSSHSEALIIKNNQSMEPPISWPVFDASECN